MDYSKLSSKEWEALIKEKFPNKYDRVDLEGDYPEGTFQWYVQGQMIAEHRERGVFD